MDYKTLMDRIKAAEAKKKAVKENKKEEPTIEEVREEVKEEPTIEVKVEEALESEKVEEHVEEPVREAEIEEVKIVEEKPVNKKKGKKPANRAYMVVEDIDEVNKEVEQTNLDF